MLVVKRVENIAVIEDRFARRRFVLAGLVVLVRQPPVERLQQQGAHREVAIVGIGAFDDHPRRFAGGGLAQRVFRHLTETSVHLVAFPVSIGHAPTGFRVLFQRLEALFLHVLGQMKPELEYQGAFGRQHALEMAQFLDRLLEGRRFGLADDPIDNRRGVPGAEQNADPSLWRQGTPKTPHRGTLGLFVRHFAEGTRDDMTRVHPLVEKIDRFALAGAVDATDDDDNGKPGAAKQIILRLQQRFAQFRLSLPVILLGDTVPDFG